ncbi:hypothetical protein [Bremerella sp. P1]|uniref:hypothetical protein n=1 Tax=Bremerella sp. P1 TaxID=3026424 RepID=UPI0023677909|nr:hypothetical protein [Bremerella sp. P1]WDI44795.1 hypothetical protein PSR63_12700 [Bremerella sp. P1]
MNVYRIENEGRTWFAVASIASDAIRAWRNEVNKFIDPDEVHMVSRDVIVGD